MTWRMASYNIHRSVGTDLRRKVDRIAAVIDEISPDVIALQEVETQQLRGGIDQAQTIAEALGMYYVHGPVLKEYSGWYGNAILSKRPAFDVRSMRFPEHSGEPRAAIRVSLKDEQGLTWTILATHLDVGYRFRGRQVRRLDRLLDDPSTNPQVLLGDLNEWWPWARSLTDLQKFGHMPDGVKTFPSWYPIFRLDRVVVRNCVLEGQLRRHMTPLARRASDHLPVYVDVRPQVGAGETEESLTECAA